MNLEEAWENLMETTDARLKAAYKDAELYMRRVIELEKALKDALYRWNGLTQERRDEIIALAGPDPLADPEYRRAEQS